eukprot:gene3935-7145_t
MLLSSVLLIISILFGIRLNNKKLTELKKPLPYLIYETIEEVKRRIKPSPYFVIQYTIKSSGDQEQYRIRGKRKPFRSILTGDDSDHHVIPYPNDPPHTFPSIKARALFTKSPKDLREVYISDKKSTSNQELKRGAKLKVPLNQLEERFRTVYSNAEKNGLELTVNALEKQQLKNWEKSGYEQTKTFDFHDVEGLLTLPLTDTIKKEEIWEKMN